MLHFLLLQRYTVIAVRRMYNVMIMSDNSVHLTPILACVEHLINMKMDSVNVSYMYMS